MKVNLISFQDKAVKDLRVDIADALDNYRRRKKTQVVSLQAPTGAGKLFPPACGIVRALPPNSWFFMPPIGRRPRCAVKAAL